MEKELRFHLGGKPMLVAITSDGRNVAREFGKTRAFEVFEIQKGRLSGRMLIDTSSGVTQKDLLYILQNEGIDTLLCGAITSEEQRELEKYQIKVITGAKGNTRSILNAYLRSERMNHTNEQDKK